MSLELKPLQILNLYKATLEDVKGCIDNAESCLNDPNTSKGTLELISLELNGQLNALINQWDDLKVTLCEDESKLSSYGTEYRHSRRSCQKTLQNVTDRIASMTVSTAQTTPTTPTVVSTLPTPKLPAIKIPNFDGNIEHWSSFWDIYDSLVHSRTDLTDVVKFATLRNYLTDRAFRSIEGLAVTNSNYNIAIKTLKDCFHNTDKLLSRLVRELNDLPVPRHAHDELLDFKLRYEKLLAQINHLERQDTSTRLFREILIKKLPSETFKILFNKYNTYHFSVDQISEGLTRIVDLMERCKEQPRSERKLENASTKSAPCDSNTTGKQNNTLHTPVKGKHNPTFRKVSSPNNQISFQNNRNPSQSTHANSFKPCLFCDESHSSKHCVRYTTLQSRRDRVRFLNLCYCCLKKGHRASDCQVKLECRNCNGNNHHTFLCAKLCNNTVANPSSYASTNIANTTSFRTPSVNANGSLPNFNPNTLPPPPLAPKVGETVNKVANPEVPTVTTTSSVSVASFTNFCSGNKVSSLSITALPTALVQVSVGGQ